MSKFSFNKPKNWSELPLFEKIAFTRKRFTANFAPYVDKLEAKKIVKEVCGDKIHIPKVVRILENCEDISQKDINPEHMIKSAHGSGYNINFYRDMRKNDINVIREKLKENNKKYNPGYETQYKYLEPKFFIEEKVDDKQFGKNGNAITYMLRCFHGVPATITFLDKKLNQQDHYLFNNDKTITKVDIDYSFFEKQKPISFKLDMPNQTMINRMYELASMLSKPFEFVRIDFYIGKGDKIYFSEYTFTPGAGAQNYPMDIEMKLGKLWK
jgi:hypothetical protein